MRDARYFPLFVRKLCSDFLRAEDMVNLREAEHIQELKRAERLFLREIKIQVALSM